METGKGNRCIGRTLRGSNFSDPYLDGCWKSHECVLVISACSTQILVFPWDYYTKYFNILETDCSTSTTGGPLGPLGPTLVPKGQAAWIVNNLNGCTPACPSGMGHGVPMDPQSWSFSLSHRFEVRHLTHKQEIPLCKFRNSWVQKKCCAKLQLLLSRSCPFWLRQAESPNFAPGTRRPV